MVCLVDGLNPALSGRPRSHPPSLCSAAVATSSLTVRPTYFPETVRRISNARRNQPRAGNLGLSVAMTQQAAVLGASAAYAREMERLSAKESLLLAFKDAGGFEALVTGKTTDIQHIDVNERIVGLERLNPTPRPTTSPFLEGKWNFEWFGTGSPGFFAARLVFERFPSTFATLSTLDAYLKDGYANITASMKLLNLVESKFVLSTKLTVEGPLRLKEEYIEGVLESPKVDDEAIPSQLKGAFDQAVNTVQQLPVPVRDAVASGLKIPLGGSFQRLFMISYLDEEILIIRNTNGIPEVLTRLDAPPSPIPESTMDYES